MSQNSWTDLVNKETGRPCMLNPFDPNPPEMEIRNDFMKNPFEKVVKRIKQKKIERIKNKN